VIALNSRPVRGIWNTVSFPSTLYLIPILDLLLAEIPATWRGELRLGLQEALVNAAKHGNKLDPRKKVLVRFSVSAHQCWWIISDQGGGFKVPQCCALHAAEDGGSHEERECGRGLYILHQIFDQVHWNPEGTELHLCKSVKDNASTPSIS
jgi:anti-sigma regulatory factor (Ser/Thr protein kinase)